MRSRAGSTITTSALTAAVLCLASLCLIGPATAANPDRAQGGPPAVRILDQVNWVNPRGEFRVTVEATATDDDSAVQARVFFPTEDPEMVRAGKVSSRTLHRGEATAVARGKATVSLKFAVVPDADGTPGDPLVLDPGVYPVRIELIDENGDRAAEAVTYLVHVAADGPRQPLNVVIPLGASPDRDPQGRPVLDDVARRSTGNRLELLAAFADLPVSLKPAPETVAAFASAPATEGRSLLARLRELADAGHEVLTSTFVRMDEAAWYHALGSDPLAGQLDLGRETLTTYGLTPAGAQAAPLALDAAPDQALITFLQGRSSADVVAPLPQAGSGTVSFVATPTGISRVLSPLKVGAGEGAQDALAAHRLLAELAVVALGNPSGSGVAIEIAAPPATDAGFLRTVLQALSEPSPFSVVTASTLLRAAAPGAPTPTVELTQTERAIAPSRSAGLQRSIARLSSLVTMIGEGAPEIAELTSDLSLAVAADLTEDQASALFGNVDTRIVAAAGGLELPRQETIVVTAHQARLPFVVRNHADRTLRVALRMRSSELDFTGPNPLVLVVPPGPTDVELPIQTRRSGEFEISVEATSPDGGLSLATTQLTVQSRAISGVGVALSIGALIFLVVWWVRNHRRRRGRERSVEDTAEQDSKTPSGAERANADGPDSSDGPDGPDDPDGPRRPVDPTDPTDPTRPAGPDRGADQPAVGARRLP